MTNTHHLIAELRDVIKNPNEYAKVERELGRLADEIVIQEKDKFYREHPEHGNR